MQKITFEEFENIMSRDISESQGCIEVAFSVDGCLEYQSSHLGKMIDRDTKKDAYWFGLVPDGSKSYDFNSFGQFANAKIFYGKSIKEIWNTISLVFVDIC